MKPVISNYKIDQETLALLPAKQIDYDTTVMETNTNQYVSQIPFDLIKSSCIKYWSTYRGRLDSIKKNLNFTQKVPILVSETKGIYFFPTHSPEHHDNCWIAWKHILEVDKAPKNTNGKQSMIIFKSGQSLLLDVSLHTIRSQMDRTFQCFFQIEGMM